MSSEPTQGQLQLQTPGDILRKAREEKQLTQEEIARQLNLKIEIILALEQDQYERIAAPTYTKGYLRSCARVLDVEPESLIELFDNSQNHTEHPEILPKVSKPSQITSSDKPVKLVTYLITFSLVFLVLIWWYGKIPLNNPLNLLMGNQGSDSNIIETVIHENGFNYEFETITHPSDRRYKAKLSAEDYRETPLLNTEETTISSDILTINESEIITEEPETTSNHSASQTVQNTLTDTDINTNAVIVTDKENLTLLIKKESWIEIYDAENNRLYLDLAKPGNVISLSGTLPYSILLGNAEGVRLQFRGEDYDLKPHTSLGVARLKLGE